MLGKSVHIFAQVVIVKDLLGVREQFLCHVANPGSPVADDNDFFVTAVAVHTWYRTVFYQDGFGRRRNGRACGGNGRACRIQTATGDMPLSQTVRHVDDTGIY